MFITHRLLKHDTNKKEEEHEDVVDNVNCDSVKDDSSTVMDRKRQVVKGWFDFHGELLPVDAIDKEGSEDFSDEPTEFNMEVGVGRHDHSFSYTIYDQVKPPSKCCNEDLEWTKDKESSDSKNRPKTKMIVLWKFVKGDSFGKKLQDLWPKIFKASKILCLRL